MLSGKNKEEQRFETDFLWFRLAFKSHGRLIKMNIFFLFWLVKFILSSLSLLT